jgi:5'-nucleotidase
LKRKLRQILISNDDGLDSPFLGRFLDAFSGIAESVVCVVPANEQSWIGRAYSRHKTLTFKEREARGNVRICTVDGTPADCVNIALGHVLKEKPDAVISGMNIGHNLALPLLWSSGTFAAAVEGAAMGCPAFACSLQLANEYYEMCRLRHSAPPESLDATLKAACLHSASFVARKLASGNLEAFTVHNMNYPSGYLESSEFKMCEPARVTVKPLHNEMSEGKFEFKYSIGDDISPDGVLTDMECVRNSWACCSVVKIV